MTESDPIDGATVVLTGATAGIGRASAERLAARGARLVLVGRDPARGARAVREITAATGNPAVEFLAADLSSQAAVRAAADELGRRPAGIDVLVNNVGGLYAYRWLTADGREASLAMNFLNPLLLTSLLRPALRGHALGRPRAVFVSSSVIRMVRPTLDDPDAARWYRGLDVYGRTKLLGALAAVELGRRAPELDVVVVDPGSAATDMTAVMVPRMAPPWMRVAWPAFRVMQRRASVGPATVSTLRAVTDPRLAGRSGLWLDARGRERSPARLRDAATARAAYEYAARELGLAERQAERA